MLCICDPCLLPIQDPAIPFFLGTGPQCKCISTTVGLRETVGAKLGWSERGGEESEVKVRIGGGGGEVERERTKEQYKGGEGRVKRLSQQRWLLGPAHHTTVTLLPYPTSYTFSTLV